MILWFSGPTGAGKSSLAKALEGRGWTVIKEAIDTGLFANFSADPRTHCATLQSSIMRSRQSQWAQLQGRKKVIFDRTAEEDFHIFCRMHAANGLLSESELSSLHAVSREVAENTPNPDLILYLRPDADVLAERVAAGHPTVISKNLASQISLYDDWISGRQENVLKWNNSRCALDAISRFLGEL